MRRYLSTLIEKSNGKNGICAVYNKNSAVMAKTWTTKFQVDQQQQDFRRVDFIIFVSHILTQLVNNYLQ